MNNAKNIFAVINFPKEEKSAPSKLLDEDTLSKLASYGNFYTILHDKFTKDEGEEETIHRHLLLMGVDNKSLATWLEVLSLIFGVPRNCISIESVKNPRKCGRYLLHRDDEFKFQFEKNEVQTNNKRQFDSWLLGGKVTSNVVINFKGEYIDFLKEFGVENTKRYWPMVERAKVSSAKTTANDFKLQVAERIIYKATGFSSSLEKAIEAFKDVQPGSKSWEALKYLKSIKLQLDDILENGVLDE